MNKKEPKEKRLKEIIDSAVKEFLEKGYEGASMESIAKRAKLSKGGLYHHFKSKDEILLEANRIYFLPVLKLMENASKKSSAKECLRYYTINYLKHWKNHPKEMVFSFLSLAKMLADRSMWKPMTEYTEEMVSFYESILKRGIENKEFRKHDTRGRALLYYTALDGIIGLLVMDKYLSIKKVSENFYDVFIKELILK